jgi:hypothetical protein
MGLSDWLKNFRELHERARRTELPERDLKTYHAAREELARALLTAQHVALQPGQKHRRVLRVARALQADLEFSDGTVRTLTLDLSSGGFAALLARPPRVDEEAKVSLRIPGGEPLKGEARVSEVKQQAGSTRVGFEFFGMDERETERLEMFVFDVVLQQLAG